MTFDPALHYEAGNGSWYVAIGDLNGDDVPDLVLAGRSSGDVSVLLSLAGGTIAPPEIYVSGDHPESLAIGDLNGDQFSDLAVANNYGDTVSVFLNLGDGTFGAAVPYAAGISPSSVAIADLNGDSALDLAISNEDSDDVAVLLGVGDGTFLAAAHYNTGEFSTSVAIGDLNSDQMPDLVVSNAGTTFGDRVSVLLGHGDGTFASAVNYAAGRGPRAVAIGDLNGDQVPDIAVANQHDHPIIDEDDVSVLFGFGDGTFAPAMHLFSGERAVSVAIGDLDYDEIPDLIVANQNDQNIAVLRGLGDGTFLPALHFAPGESPTSVAIGDLDGDFVSDMVVACCGNQVSILVNQIDDTDGDGVNDQLDPCPFDNPDDTDGDTVCDKWDICPGGNDAVDGDGDGLPDVCDACDNNVPGACTLVSTVSAGPPHDVLKNRYLSIDPRGADQSNVGHEFDIRVRLTSTLVNGVTAGGSSWWANAPDANCISIVGPTQPASPIDWDACPTLHITGCPIMPTSTYDIVPEIDGLQFGPALTVETQLKPADNKWWGDTVGSYDAVLQTWSAPQGIVNIDDAVAAMRTFQDSDADNATHVTVTDVHPNRPTLAPRFRLPNQIVNIDDVFQIILGFQGNEFPGPEIHLCVDP